MKEKQYSAIFLIIQIALAGFVGCAGPFDPEAELRSLPGRIYFNSNRTGNLEIFSCNPDGTGIRNLTRSTDTDNWFPTVSPDATRVAFMKGSMRKIDSFEIWMMDADGSNQRQLTFNDSIDGHPDFSPDGNQIVFASRRDGNEDIYIMNSDGTGQTRLTDHPATDNDPDWSPDGTKIAFKSTRAYTSSSESEFIDIDFEIYTVNTDGTGLQRITDDRFSDHDPDFSPEGTMIAFLRGSKNESDTWIMDDDGSNQRNLSNNGKSWYSSWSPDGTRIAFVSNISAFTNIWIMDADGSNHLQVSYSIFSDNYPAWR